MGIGKLLGAGISKGRFRVLLVAVVAMGAAFPSMSTAATWIDSGELSSALDDVHSASIANVGGVPYLAWFETGGHYLASLGIFVDQFSNGAWSPAVSGSLDRSGGDPSITSIGGVPYVAWVDGGQVLVAERVGNVWTRVGDPVGGPGAGAPSITSDGVHPWVAWTQSFATDSVGDSTIGVFVSEFINSAWQQPQLVSSSTHNAQVHTSAASILVPPSARATALVLPPTTTQTFMPYITWSEFDRATGQSRIWVIRCRTGAQCVTVGGSIGNNQGSTPSIASVNGIPYVAWCTIAVPFSYDCQQIRVVRLSAGSWVPVGDAVSLSASGPRGAPAITDVGGTPWVAWGDTEAPHVSQFGAGLWENVGGSLGAPALLSMTTVGGVPYVALAGGGGSENLHVEFLMRQKPLAVTAFGARRTSTGITFTVGLRTASAVRLDFMQPAAGREIAGNCVPQTASNLSMPPCRRMMILGTIRYHGLAGLNKLVFNGRFSNNKTLKPGRYWVNLTATASGGRRSVPDWLTVTI